MVFYYQPSNPAFQIYMGRDKYENEDLIKYGWQNDVWFHVDDMSSAHVYLRLPPGMEIDSIPEDMLEECSQLVKQNSIEGCKKNNVRIVYTAWSNLKKNADMDVGQVGFHVQSKVRHLMVEKKKNEIVNKLKKTEEEKYPNLAEQQEEALRAITRQKRDEHKKTKAEEKRLEEEKRAEKASKSYDNLFKEEKMKSNYDNDGDVDYRAVEEDFM
eukprot:TRINITY_DN11572_c0_g1::TRINITY_DN11572_c0_g1_i1::g.22026::m.22026 TRINITY_DN11572_c0_g1::TRINITY_DN11572_c0_g1_i1::g.22026  ORF type:complete len:230 (-),score=76.71,sp/Q7T312/CCD25_DANRE/54.41/1e-69,DUF814/PF05670.8/2.5e-24,DUF814/PF05670.8/1.3e+04,DUF1764/PF08576.5/14 TRINITY_DN11572_c0_g1_i1:74-712(-)